jgi:4-amino-4-deoxy-L-arabinose transferase-like glycosyltransferase
MVLPVYRSLTRLARSLTRWDLAVIAWLAGTRLALVALVYPDRARMFTGDSALYDGLARALLHGEYAYAPMGAFSDIIRPPGFPSFIAANYAVFGADPLWPILWNVPFAVAVYLGVRALVRRTGEQLHPAVGVVFGLDLAWLLYSKELVTEPLFTALLLGALGLLLRGAEREHMGQIAASGLGVGLCALIKPIALYLPIVLAVYLGGWAVRERWAWRPAAFRVLVLVGAFGLAVGPWFVRNAVVHETPTFTSVQAGNFLGGHAAFVWAEVRSLTHFEAKGELEAEVARQVWAEHGADAPYVALQAAQGAVAREVLAAHPWLYLKAITRGVAVTLFDPGRLVLNRTFPHDDPAAIGLTNTLARDGVWGTLRHLADRPLTQTIPLTVYLLFLGGVVVVALIGLGPAFRRAPRVAWLCLLVGGYLLVLGGPHGYARFRLYVFPFMLVAVHFGATWLAVQWRARRAIA